MKKIFLLSIAFFALFLQAFSQDIEWAFKVLHHTSQRGTREYAAVQVLGKPNALPSRTENTNAWEPKTGENESSITVGFFTPIIPKQIIVAESFHPGHITAAYLYDVDGKEHPITTVTGYASPHGLLHIKTPGINFNIIGVKLVLKHGGTAVGIDAIGLTTSDVHFRIKLSPNDEIKADMIVTAMSKNVNTSYTEIGPLISPDGKTLYFSRRGDPNDVGGLKDEEDIWYATWNDTTKNWNQAINLGAPINTAEPNFINSISPDGNTLLLGNSYLANGTMEDGVSISRKTEKGVWSFPKRLVIAEEGYSHSNMVSYFMGNSEKVLIISTQPKEDTYGKNDLYVSFLLADTTWTKPLNLGNTINSAGFEDAPFLASDAKTLYFASNKPNGYGGTDIYMSRRLDDTWQNWSKPENLGPAVNSSHDESFFSISATGKQAYFTSQVSNTEDVDMFVVDIPAILRPNPVLLVHGNVLDSKTKQPLTGVHISYINLETAKEIGMADADYDSASYTIVLPAGKAYSYYAIKKGYISVQTYQNVSDLDAYKEIEQDIYLAPIEAGQVIVLNTVTFDVNKTEINIPSFYELDQLIELLKNNPTLKIELTAIADPSGDNNALDKLSDKRTETVYTYLIQKSGLDKSRITFKPVSEIPDASNKKASQNKVVTKCIAYKIISN